ncbi:MAG: APC family permease [Rhodovibrionaceae bacterium]
MTEPAPANPPQTELKRSLNLALLTLYGLGVTVGAGIYVLVGKVAGHAGMGAPLSFLGAAVLVAFSALSFAELAVRMPKSAGEALYVREAFGAPRLGLIVGLMVVAAGVISSAVIVQGAVGYLQQLFPLNANLGILLVTSILATVAVWGITQSVTLAGIVTVVEISGLLLVLAAGLLADPRPDFAAADFAPTLRPEAWFGVLAGITLAFFAFIGFEDMVNVAEEVKAVERTLPRAILLTLVVSSLLYIAIAAVALKVLTPAELSASSAPLAEIWQRGFAGDPGLLSVIAVFATLNGVLIQMIMASRVLYGLGRQGSLPAFLGNLHPRTRTPAIATALVGAFVLLLAFSLSLERLAEITSAVVLAVFTLVNLALVRLKLRRPAPLSGLRVPLAVPAIGAAISFAALASLVWRLVLIL